MQLCVQEQRTKTSMAVSKEKKTAIVFVAENTDIIFLFVSAKSKNIEAPCTLWAGNKTSSV